MASISSQAINASQAYPDFAVDNGFADLFQRLSSLGLPKALGLLLGSLWLISFVFRSRKLPNAPVYGYRSALEPTFLLQSRFIMGAHDIIKGAYQKVVIALSRKYLKVYSDTYTDEKSTICAPPLGCGLLGAANAIFGRNSIDANLKT